MLELVEINGVWPQGSWDAYIAMIPKADGDSTPLGQRPLSVLPVVYRPVGLAQELVICGIGSRDGYLSLFLVWVMVSLLWKPWFATSLDIEEVLSGVGGDQLHVMVADVIRSFDTVDRSILDCTLGRLGLPGWFRKANFAFHCQVRLRFKLAAGFR